LSASALHAYLTDHRAGGAAGSQLAAKLRAKHAGTSDETFYASLADEIEADRLTLDRLISSLGLPKHRAKQAAGWLVEKLSRLRFNERVTRSAQLTSLFELETLSLGIGGKLALWKSLGEVANSHTVLAAVDFDRLAARAQEQFEGLERRRLDAATAALRA
jgi:hypothetical protein